MKESTDQLAERLRARFGAAPFRVLDAVQTGASRSSLHRLRERGNLESAGHGVLRFAGGGDGLLSGLAVVSARVPAGTICLNSALAYWDLSDEIPAEVHIAIPRGAHRPAIDRPPTKTHVFDAATFAVGRQQALTDVDEPFWVYSAERSIIDAIRMSRWVGRDVALHALRLYMRRPGANPGLLADLARDVGGSAQLEPALEALLS